VAAPAAANVVVQPALSSSMASGNVDTRLPSAPSAAVTAASAA
jgi:hypothetical protein